MRLERRPWTRQPGVVLALAAGIVAVTAAVALTGSPNWPTGCRTDGRSEWCAEPSGAMTDRSMTALAHHYCPRLSVVSLADVVPQPLSQMELAGPETLAKTTGSARKGTEDALLGEPGNFAWITRWVGGDKDGLVEVRCPGDSGNVPGLALTVDQFGSTLAALNAADEMHIDFGEVAKRSVAAMSKASRLTCPSDSSPATPKVST